MRGYTAPSPSRAELAHREINVGDEMDRRYLGSTVAQSTGASIDSWENFRRIGEVRFAIARSARIAGYAELKGVRVDTAGAVVQEARDGSVVSGIVDSIYGRFGGTRGLFERFYTLRKVVGDSYLIRLREDDMVDGYWFLSPSEITNESTTPYQAAGMARDGKSVTWVTSRGGTRHGDVDKDAFQRTVQASDFLGRVWAPDNEHVDDADSPMLALNDMCEMLHMLTQLIKGRLRQRFALAGILLIPQEISDAAIAGTQPTGVQYSDDKVLNYLIHVMTRNVTAHDLGISQIPILLKGPADVLEKVRHLILEAMVAETDLKLRQELIQRILDGLDQQKQAVRGGEETSHWGMWAVSDEERRITVQPDIESACWAFTRMILHRELQERRWEPGRIRPWRVGFDLSAAAVKSNMGEDARQAWDRGSVSGEFLRTVMGAKDTDAMVGDEYVRWVGQKVGNAYLACHNLQGVDVDWEEAAAWGNSTPGPVPDSGADDPEAGPGVGQPGSPDDRDSDTPDTEEPG